jgi:tetratricopeptide (TPR) repeat protein
MRTAEGHLVAFIDLLNDESMLGVTAAAAILAQPPADRPRLFAEHPEWLRTGTFDVLLANARDEMNRSALRAAEITGFVLEYLPLIRTQPGGELLLTIVRGTAHKDHASALYRRGKDYLAGALAHVQEALRIFKERPALFLECASARFVQAQIYQALGQLRAALAVLDECECVFAENGDAHRYLQVLEQRGFCYFEQAECATGRSRAASFEAASKDFLAALEEAERIPDREERARILNNLGHCAYELNDRIGARSYLERAITEFTDLGMTADVQRSLWGIAEIELLDGYPEAALVRLRSVYDEFVKRGMLGVAAMVRLEIAVKLSAALHNPRLAQEECASLASNPAAQHLPPSALKAASFLGLREVVTNDDVAYTASFLGRLAVDPAAPFEVPQA